MTCPPLRALSAVALAALLGLTSAASGCSSDGADSDRASGDALTPADPDAARDPDAPAGPDAVGDLDAVVTDPDASVTDPDAAVTDGQPAPSDLADGDLPPAGPGLVRIATPRAALTVEGSIAVDLVPDDRDERLVDAVRLKVNGLVVATDTKLPTRFVLDTRAVPSGPLELVAEAEDGPDRGRDVVSVVIDNPPVRFLAVRPERAAVRDGETVTLDVQVEAPGPVVLAADFARLDSGFDPARVVVTPGARGAFTVTYVLTPDNDRPDGVHPVPLLATLDGRSVPFDGLTLRLRNGAAAGVSVPNAFHVPAPAPDPTPGWVVAAPTVTAANASVVTGGTTDVRASLWEVPDGDRIVGLIVSVDGQPGHWQVPVDPSAPPADGLVTATIRVSQDYVAATPSPPPVNLRLALRDARGRVSAAAPFRLAVLRVGGGDLQFSLSWSTPADLDLHVVDPLACRVYYANKQCSPSGGRLDLDSNVSCRAGPALENVFYPTGSAPAGLYEVQVVTYGDNCCPSGTCSAGHPYTLTINACGRTETLTGTLPFQNRRSAAVSEAVTIAQVDNSRCDRLATGQIRYEDKPFDARGFGDSRWQQVAGVVVELREAATGAVLAAGVTDLNGDYMIRFASEAPAYVVAVRTETSAEEGLRRIRVMNHPKFKRVHEVVSAPVTLSDDARAPSVLDLDIPIADGAGAFNIFDTSRAAWDAVRLATGRNPPDLRVFWATGTDTTETRYCSPTLFDAGACTERHAVSVQGRDEDRDEYDDMIIAREFFRFALNNLARDSHPGEPSDGRRTDARAAFGDGVSAVLAADLFGSRHFVDSRPFGLYVVDDLEAMPTPFASRVVDQALSRYLVMAVLHDLIDPPQAPDAEPHDAVHGGRSALFDALFTHLGGPAWTDRGADGVELVDLLDGWLCRGWPGRPALDGLLAHHAFGYDFGGPSGCWP